MDGVQSKEENCRFDDWSSFLGEEEKSFNVPVKKSFLFFILDLSGRRLSIDCIRISFHRYHMSFGSLIISVSDHALCGRSPLGS